MRRAASLLVGRLDRRQPELLLEGVGPALVRGDKRGPGLVKRPYNWTVDLRCGGHACDVTAGLDRRGSHTLHHRFASRYRQPAIVGIKTQLGDVADKLPLQLRRGVSKSVLDQGLALEDVSRHSPEKRVHGKFEPAHFLSWGVLIAQLRNQVEHVSLPCGLGPAEDVEFVV